MISLIVKLPVQPEKREELVAALKELAAHAALEEGTLGYSVNISKAVPDAVVLLERYRDKAAFDVHAASAPVKAFFARAPELLDGNPEITFLDEVAGI